VEPLVILDSQQKKSAYRHFCFWGDNPLSLYELVETFLRLAASLDFRRAASFLWITPFATPLSSRLVTSENLLICCSSVPSCRASLYLRIEVLILDFIITFRSRRFWLCLTRLIADLVFGMVSPPSAQGYSNTCLTQFQEDQSAILLTIGASLTALRIWTDPCSCIFFVPWTVLFICLNDFLS
jgi:hypothetical protein